MSGFKKPNWNQSLSDNYHLKLVSFLIILMDRVINWLFDMILNSSENTLYVPY